MLEDRLAVRAQQEPAQRARRVDVGGALEDRRRPVPGADRCSTGISNSRPRPFTFGASASDSATMPASAAPLCDELHRLRDVLAEHQLRPHGDRRRRPTCIAATAARPYGACSGLAIATCATDASRQRLQTLVLDVERRRRRRPDDEAADRVGELALRHASARARRAGSGRRRRPTGTCRTAPG